MKQFFKAHNKHCRAAAMLVVVYAVHLFAALVLLSNPNDYLSRNSFCHHQSNPGQSTDCLLLLAKKETVKHMLLDDFTPALLSFSILHVSFPELLWQPTVTPQSLSADSYKRYLLLSTYLI
jgi:hypothetical protein